MPADTCLSNMQLTANSAAGISEMMVRAVPRPQPQNSMPQGVIKWFNNKKGFGFIADPSGASADIFVHYSEIRGDGYKTLEEGDTVEFELAPSDRGPKALNVVKI